MIPKKVLFIFMVLLSAMIVSSCGKDFLEKPIQPGAQSDASYYSTSSGLNNMLTSAYWPLSYDYSANIQYLGDHRSDDSQVGGENAEDGIAQHKIGDFIIFSDNGIMWDIWRNLYSGIAYSNIVINNAPKALKKPAIDGPVLKSLVGQAKCLRGFYYFELVKNFGDVPYITNTNSVIPTPRIDYKIVLDSAQADLIAAAASLPKANQLAATDKGRTHNGSAQAVLVKIYMLRAALEPEKATQYQTSAYEAAKAVIESGQFTLLPNYHSLYTIAGNNSTESIIDGASPPEGEQGAGWYWTNIIQCPRYYYLKGTRKKGAAAEFGWGFNTPTQDFVNAFEAGDPRKNWSIWFEGDSTAGTNKMSELLQINFDHSNTGYYNRKYTTESYPGGLTGHLNVKIYRYADLLLLGAEAANEIGKTSDALKWLNMVRERARNTPAAPNHSANVIAGVPADISITDPTELRTIIRHERRIELGLEGHRFYDLVRWDGLHGFDIKKTIQDAQKLKGPNYAIDADDPASKERPEHIVIFDNPKHKLLPIPKSEIDATGGLLRQNPGY